MCRLAALACVLLVCACDNEVPILGYHWVDGHTGLIWDLEPEKLAAHLDEIQRLGFNTVTLHELYDDLDGRADLPPHPVVLTFDDGHEGLYRVAFPMLRERGMRAEVFLIESYIRDDPANRYIWKDVGAEIPILTWPEIEEMQASGTFHFQSHSRTHVHLNQIPIEAAQVEIELSRARLSERLKVPVEFFAYPGNNLGSQVIHDVEAAGYRGAVAGRNRLGGRFAMWRMGVHSGDSPELVRNLLARTWADSYSR
jgi:peptidoglycan/xylan/chitin deacetylase (PgdA/CDA1 family)